MKFVVFHNANAILIQLFLPLISSKQNGESKPVPAEKRSSIDEKPKKKTLPELDKYWKVVNDDPTDFTGWTYLLQYVDQEVITSFIIYKLIHSVIIVAYI